MESEETLNLLRHLKKEREHKLNQNSEDLANVRNEFQNELLKKTLLFATENVPYYREIFKNINLDTQLMEGDSYLDNLNKIPLLTKELVFSNMKYLVSEKSTIVGLRYSSGTEHAQRMTIYTSREELESKSIWNELKIRALRFGKAGDLTLRIILGRTGISPYPQDPFIILPYQVHSSSSFNTLLVNELNREHFIPNVSNKINIISLPTPWLIRLITNDLISMGYNTQSSNLKAITSSGGHASKALRKMVKENWNTPFFGSYNLSEVCGTAPECKYYNGYHFDETMIVQAVDPKSLEKIKIQNTEGLILLTTLFPFQQAMPLINYLTKDLGVLDNADCQCGYSGITLKKYIGRLKFCYYFGDIVPKNSKRKWFSYVDIFEPLEEFKELTYERPRFNYNVEKHNSIYTIKINIQPVVPLNNHLKELINDRLSSYILSSYPEWNNLFTSNEIIIESNFLNPNNTPFNMYNFIPV